MIDSFPFIAALIASILHVITGPDHLAAVVPFAVDAKRKAWKIGLFWGIGHLLGMILIGVLFFLFRELIPVEKISGYSEQLVGLVLIFIGVWSFYKLFKQEKKHKHLHVHANDDVTIHKHEHHHHENQNHTHHHDGIKQGNFASLSVGFLHGLAGIAHFILFLPVASFDSKMDSINYLIGTAVGILIAMTVFAFVIGSISSYAKNEHNEMLFKGIRFAGGLFAIIIGFYWIFAN